MMQTEPIAPPAAEDTPLPEPATRGLRMPEILIALITVANVLLNVYPGLLPRYFMTTNLMVSYAVEGVVLTIPNLILIFVIIRFRDRFFSNQYTYWAVLLLNCIATAMVLGGAIMMILDIFLNSWEYVK